MEKFGKLWEVFISFRKIWKINETKKEWGKMRVVFLANKDLTLSLIEKGYSLKEILRKNPTLNISYDALASYVRKYFKTKPAAIITQTSLPISVDPIKKKSMPHVFEHNTNKKLEDMI
ncbi:MULTISPECIES: TraK family protein [unclassified Bartonella]|uniref:TraK family protein n=1 Tax=unclassified Bartonella TaxID=2645622 RepID=UPI001FDA6CF8|nr:MULTISPECIES: TraK family protein [unclassified Bartonella]